MKKIPVYGILTYVLWIGLILGMLSCLARGEIISFTAMMFVMMIFYIIFLSKDD